MNLNTPLTKQWAIDFGFEWYEALSHYRLIIDDVWYQIDKNMMFTFVNLNDDETKFMPKKKIHFVHKFQNLMYELSGVELTLNKTK